jgi:hypothetical protein
MSAVRKRMDFEFKKLLDGRNIDVDMQEAKELQQNITKKLNEGILMPENVHDLLDLYNDNMREYVQSLQTSTTI